MDAMSDGRYGQSFVADDRWMSPSDAPCGLHGYHILFLAWGD
jgi:hypothetical protein